eukprot:6212585-Pyramimonas_sp.AAC.1
MEIENNTKTKNTDQVQPCPIPIALSPSRPPPNYHPSWGCTPRNQKGRTHTYTPHSHLYPW